MSDDRLSFTEFMVRKNENRRRVKLVSKALALLEMEEVAVLRNILLEESSYLTAFRYGITRFGDEVGLVPKEWDKYINSGESLLHFACRKGNKQAAELLISFGADVNCQSLPPLGETPLHIAAIISLENMLDMLLEHGAQSTAKNADHESAFLVACKQGKESFALKIMGMGTEKDSIIGDYNARNSHGQSALWLACSNGLLEVALELLKEENVSLTEAPDNDGRSLLHAACLYNRIEVATFLINNGSSPESKGWYPDKFGRLPLSYVSSAEAKRTLQLAEEQYLSGGGHTGLRIRRKDAEERLQGGRAFNWFKELQSVDGRKGIHSTKGESDIFVVHASKHQKTKMNTFIEKGAYASDEEPEEHDIYDPLSSEESSKATATRGNLQDEEDIEKDEGQAEECCTVTDSIDLTRRLDSSFDGKQDHLAYVRPAAKLVPYDPHAVAMDSTELESAASWEDGGTQEASLSSSHIRLLEEERRLQEEREVPLMKQSGVDYVPSIYDFLVKYCQFEPAKAMNCARISKLRNILHLNKLYVILQALESMQQTNFTFKDIGVFYADEMKVRRALKWYYRSGAITSLGVTVEADNGFEDFTERHNHLKNSQKHHRVLLEGDSAAMVKHKAFDAKTQQANEEALMFVYRTRKPKLGRHVVPQKYQAEEKARIAEIEAADRLKNLFH